MKSLRLDEKLAGRVSKTAQRLGVSDSEVMRRALDDYCDPAPGESLAEALGDYIGFTKDSKGQFTAREHHEAFGQMVEEKWRRRLDKSIRSLPRVAEARAKYQGQD